MPNLNDRGLTDIKPYSLQQIFNQSFDRDAQVLVIEGVGFDGQNVQKQDADNVSIKITKDSGNTYIGEAAPGTSEASALWKATKIAADGRVTYADSNSNYDNIATDLVALTYG